MSHKIADALLIPRWRSLAKAGMQPGPGVGPVSIGLGAGEAQGHAGLLDGEPGEEAELHELGGVRLRRRQPGEGLIELQDVIGRGGPGEVDLREVDSQAAAAAVFVGPLAACPFDEDSSRRLGRGRRSIGPGSPIAGPPWPGATGERPRGPALWPGVSDQASPERASAWPAGAARRRPAAGAVRPPAGRPARLPRGCG